MSLRNLVDSKASGEGLQEDLELIERRNGISGGHHVVESDVDVETDTALLRHYRAGTGNPEEHNGHDKLELRAFLVNSMSRVPLLGRSVAALSGSNTYGALQNPGANHQDAIDNGNVHEVGTESRSDDAVLDAGSSGHIRSSGTRVRRRSQRGPHQRKPRNSNDSSVSNGVDITSDTTSEEDEDHGEAISIDEDVLPDNSPYPEVRASVAAIDDTTASINTPRMWFLSMLCALLGSATNLFFSLRYPSVAITPVVALVVVHPLGLAWDRLLKRNGDPAETFEMGVLVQPRKRTQLLSKITRLRIWLAQGNWNGKEHACVYISSNVSFGFAFATDVIVEQAKFYHQDLSIIYQLLLTISTQILGYSFAGLTRRYLVRPSSMIWPGTLMSTAMFTTFHSNENKPANGRMVTRWNLFLYIWSGAFAWYFLPGLLMPALSYFSVITWFAPSNVVIANLFGVASGLGLFPMTFNWAQIAYIGSPLLTPFWAAANVVGGLVIVMWIIAPIMYYYNVFFSAFLPILSSSVFDDTGKPYHVSKILTPDYHFDHKAYSQYSKVYLPITYALAYGVQFAGLTALVTHTACWHGHEIWRQFRQSLTEGGKVRAEYQPVNQGPPHKSDPGSSKPTAGPGMSSVTGQDVHNRLMKRYEDAPISWYLATFVTMLAIGIFVVEYYPVYLPWYGLILALVITAILFIPVGIVMAITNQHSSLYLICQIICGAVFPGRPVANMVFVTYCYISSAQGIKFSSDLKLGHYMKIPPKLLFKVQMAATLISSFTQIGVLNWMFAYIPSLCTTEAINGFTCPLARVHFNGSILWGVVGPQRFFGKDALYRPLIWAFLVGLLAPIGVWLVGRKTVGNSVWRKINLPVLFGSLSWIPPATGLNFSVWALVCFFFNFHLRRRAPAWWGKYTMTLSAALDSGLAFGVVVVFFAFLYPGWNWLEKLDWWGTRVYKEGCDWQACPYKTLEPGEHFGRT